jgi:RNA recognition motif-containing protein
MAKTLYVGNLPWTTSEEDLRRIFAGHASVESARVIVDRETGRSRGFGFVEVADADVERAVISMNGAVIFGRPLIVNEAQPRQAALRRS